MIVELTLTIQCHKNAFIQLYYYCAKHLRTITIADQILHWETLLSTSSLIHILTLYTQNVQNGKDTVACFEILHKAFLFYYCPWGQIFKEKEHTLSAVLWLGFSLSGDGGMRGAFESAASQREGRACWSQNSSLAPSDISGQSFQP